MAVTPAPPGLFSTNTLWPSCLVSSAATERATISLVPPGCGQHQKRIGLVARRLRAQARQGHGGGSTGQQLAAVDLGDGGHACLRGWFAPASLRGRLRIIWYLLLNPIHRSHRAPEM